MGATRALNDPSPYLYKGRALTFLNSHARHDATELEHIFGTAVRRCVLSWQANVVNMYILSVLSLSYLSARLEVYLTMFIAAAAPSTHSGGSLYGKILYTVNFPPVNPSSVLCSDLVKWDVKIRGE